MRIAIDIGHARRTGSAGNGLQEHESAAALARLLAGYLSNTHEVEIIDFPNLSNSADLAETVRAINLDDFDFSISLHCDHNDSPSPHGAHVCYLSQTGKRLAKAIAAHLCKLMPGRAEKVQHRPGLYVLNSTKCPAVLCECGFISNPADAAMLQHEPHRIARAIAMGVADYVKA